ncbi:IgGFc-binding protein [Scomber scombrus]|uniref:IgGFc-binding protein n=1 Tax=Scomber scombrus TaxID=13677 RepID=A0AAV1NPR5_SCOSC
MSSSFLLAMASINFDVDTGQKNVSLLGSILKVIPVVTSDKIHITSDNRIQLILHRLDNGQCSSTLTALLSVDDICQSVPMFDSDAASYEKLYCGQKLTWSIKDTKPICSKICSAAGDSYYRTFDRRDLVPLGKDCHSHIDPEPFVHSSVNNLCVSGATSSMCKALMAYANVCQRLGAKVQNWRTIAKCLCNSTMAAKIASHSLNGMVLAPAGSFSGCHSIVDPEPFFQNCVNDINQTFWAVEGCTEQCICDPYTHQTQCHLDFCGSNEYSGLYDELGRCLLHPQQTCMYTCHPIVTFDQHDCKLHGTCQYQLLVICGQN